MTYFFGNIMPAIEKADDKKDVMLGFNFYVNSDSIISSIRIWRNETKPTTFPLFIWDQDGKLIYQSTISVGKSRNWHTKKLAQPIAIKANVRYTIGYFSKRGGYPVTQNAGLNNAGVFNYAKEMPRQSYKDSNYFIDADVTVKWQPPQFTVHPQSATIAANEFVTLKAAASGSQPIRYTWQKHIAGTWQEIGTGPSITVNEIGKYRCVASNEIGICASNIAELKFELRKPPVILQQPDLNIEVYVGNTLTLNVVAENATRWQWYTLTDGTWQPIANGNEPTLVLENMQQAQSGMLVHCACSNDAGTVFSNTSSIVVRDNAKVHGQDINAYNTGAILSPLKVVTNICFASEAPNGVYDSLDMRAGIVIDAPVKLINCYIHSQVKTNGHWTVLTNCTIRPDEVADWCLGDENFYALRCHISNGSDGVRAGGGTLGSTLRECYIRCATQSEQDHNDGVQNYAGVGDLTLLANNIDISNMPGANAAFMAADNAKGHCILQDNFFAGGGWTVRLYEDMSYTLSGNVIIAGQFGPVAIYNPNNRPIIGI